MYIEEFLPPLMLLPSYHRWERSLYIDTERLLRLDELKLMPVNGKN